MRFQILMVFVFLSAVLLNRPHCRSEWVDHEVRQLNGQSNALRIPAKIQIITAAKEQKAVTPYMVYMPEKKRLLMLVSIGVPDFLAMTCISDDFGKTWSQPKPVSAPSRGKPVAPLCLALAYLGDGRLIANEEAGRRWSSDDYGETWTSDGLPKIPRGMAAWDPALMTSRSVDGSVLLAQTCYKEVHSLPNALNTQGCLIFSHDKGKTWSEPKSVPQWLGVNEVALTRAKNGDWIAACRTMWPDRYAHLNFDHWCGLAVSISKDEGKTWSEKNVLYEWGRHHPCTIVMSNGDLVMSYAVRLGYANKANGARQFGIEAIVSHDNGATWDLDHRYILDIWSGNSANASSQATSSVLLPDGTILTAYGTGYRAKASDYFPRDIGLVRWQLGTEPINNDRTLRDAAFDSPIRNNFDPAKLK